jgi:ketosteroid isomerase-like protein
MVSSPSNQDADAIESLVRQHGENFKSKDARAQLALWDSEYPAPTYLPTELDEPLRTWGDIQRYFEEVIPLYGAALWEISLFELDFLADDVAFAVAVVEYEPAVRQERYRATEAGGKWMRRMSYVVRRTGAGWKIIHGQDSTLDLFRAYQLWEDHKVRGERAVEMLKTISTRYSPQ